MGPKTRSMAQEKLFFIDNVEQICNTLDPIQKTFECGKSSLPFWRYTLYHRYVGKYRPRGLSATWEDYEAKHQLYSKQCDVDSFTSPIPSDLQQSTLIVHTASDKVLTIHVYYTTGTILVQGKACGEWVEKEFEKLRAIVHTLTTGDACPDRLSITDLRQPDHPTTRGTCIMNSGSTGAAEDDKLAAHSAEPCEQEGAVIFSSTSTSDSAPVSSPSSPSDTLSTHTSVEPEPELACQRGSAVLSPPPSLQPPSTSTSNNAPPSPSSPNPDHPNAELQAPQSPSPSLPVSNEQKTITSSSPPSTQLTDVTTPFITTAGAADNTAELTSVSDTLNSATVTEGSSQTDFTCCSGDCVSRAEFDSAIQTLQAEVSALRSALQEARQTFTIETDSITTQLTHLKQSSQTSFSSKQHKSPSSGSKNHNEKKQHSLSHNKSSSPDPESAAPQTPPSSAQTDSSTIAKTNAENAKLMMTSTEKDNVDDLEPSTPYPLKRLTVGKNTGAILIGDSVIKGIDMTRSFPPQSNPQKISVSELKIPQLTEWLSHQPPTTTMKRVTLHVGVNDCSQSTKSAEDGISTDTWKQLFSQCRRAFPKASLQASAILPAKGYHPLKAAIGASNKTLKRACDGMGIQYTDHSAVFTTPNGAPRLALYWNAIHPSKRGTARMAENLFPQKQPYIASVHKARDEGRTPGLTASQSRAQRHSSNHPYPRFSASRGYDTASINPHSSQAGHSSFPPPPSNTHPSSYFHPDHKHYEEHFPSLHPPVENNPPQNKEQFPRRHPPMERPPPIHPPVNTARPSNTGEEERRAYFSPQQMRPPVYPMFYPPFPPCPPPNLWPYYMNLPPSPLPPYNQPR